VRFFYIYLIYFIDKNCIITIFWRDGRVVECTGLENQQGLIPFQGSNPCPSTIHFLYEIILI
jgi:hypothetical protein